MKTIVGIYTIFETIKGQTISTYIFVDEMYLLHNLVVISIKHNAISKLEFVLQIRI